MDAASSSEERSWWWKKPSRKLTAFDLLYGLQAQEAAIGSTPSEVEVEVMGMAFVAWSEWSFFSGLDGFG